jgi:predicted acetyltransferase
LQIPDEGLRRSFLTAMDEFVAEGRGGPDDDSMIGTEIRDWGDRWSTPAGFAGFVAALRRESDEDAPRPAGIVACTTYWWGEGREYLGRVSIRHRLTPKLLARGGHIGYDVRPSARRRGHGTAMLSAARPLARALGIERALVTCAVSNAASKKIIEANGGVLEDERDGTARYWVATD